MRNPRYIVSVEDADDDFFTVTEGADPIEAVQLALNDFREFVLTEAESLQPPTVTVDGLRDIFTVHIDETLTVVQGALERLPWTEGPGCKWRSGIRTGVEEYPEVFLVVREER